MYPHINVIYLRFNPENLNLLHIVTSVPIYAYAHSREIRTHRATKFTNVYIKDIQKIKSNTHPVYYSLTVPKQGARNSVILTKYLSEVFPCGNSRQTYKAKHCSIPLVTFTKSRCYSQGFIYIASFRFTEKSRSAFNEQWKGMMSIFDSGSKIGEFIKQITRLFAKC